MEETILFSHVPGIFEDVGYQICHGYGYKYTDSVPPERVSVLLRVLGGDPVRITCPRKGDAMALSVKTAKNHPKAGGIIKRLLKQEDSTPWQT